LASIDAIGFGFRNLVYRGPNWAQEALICPFCSGYYWAVGWVATGLVWGDTWPWQLLAGSLAVNWVAGQFNSWLDVRPVHDGGGEIAAEEGE
jgi:hypothetical protein